MRFFDLYTKPMQASTGSWCSFSATLDPVWRLSLDRLRFYETRLHCYVIGTDAHRKAFRMLRFSRSNSGVMGYHDDEKVYTRSEIDSLVLSFKHEPGLRVVKAKALLGCVRFTQCYYLVLATKRRRVARIGLHRIFEVTNFDLISLAPRSSGLLSVVSMYTEGGLSTPFLTRRSTEDYYRNQFLSTTFKQKFYYSHTYDLTNTLQMNMTVSSGDREIRRKFVWNEFLIEPLFPPASANSETLDVENSLSPPGMSHWIVYLVHGCIAQFTIWCNAKPVLLTLIGRVSKNFAGVRYLRRGVSSDGHVANHVEVEQIVMDESTLHDHFTKGNFSSFLQVRGSVPIHWFHPPAQLPRPPILLGGSDTYYTNTCKHFQELLEDYGAPLVIVDLLKQWEKHPRETILGQEYRKAIALLSSFAQKSLGVEENSHRGSQLTEALHKTDVGTKTNEDPVITDGEDLISYYDFDIRNTVHDAWNTVTALAETSLEKTGFFACNGDVVRRQVGVARSNCVDCIDRTNIAQFLFGLHALGHQLHALNLLHSPVDVALSPGVQELLLDMYLLMGDAIAVQYGGSQQVGAGVLHRGTGWDSIMGMKRLFNNVMGDREKQFALNIFLGRYQPCPNPLSKSLNPVMHIPEAGTSQQSDNLLSSSLITLACGGFVGAIAKIKNVGRVVDISELESDYYLQVKSAPSFKGPDELRNWWQKPIQKFYQTFHTKRNKNLFFMSDALNIKDEEARRNASNLREISFFERLSAITSDESDTEWGMSGDATSANGVSGAGSDTEVVQLIMTDAIKTLAKHPKETPSILLSNAQLEMFRGLLANRQSSDVSVSHDKDANCDTTTEILHDYCTYPDELRKSVFARDIERFRRMCDDCEPSADISRMQLTVLSTHGDPLEWSAETVAELIAQVEPEVSAETLNHLYQMNVDGYTLLYQFDAESMEQTLILKRFIELVRRLPRSRLESARKCLELLRESVLQCQKIPEEEVDGERTAFPDATCRLLQPFFNETVYPATMAGTVRRLLREMIDGKTGVPRCDRLRYCEKPHQRVPPTAVALQCFGAKEMHQWLLCESYRLGLTFHKHVESTEASQSAWKFMIWLAHANIITHIVIEPTFGVVVRPAIKLGDFTTRSNLFTFSVLQETRVLNMDTKSPFSTDWASLFKASHLDLCEKSIFASPMLFAESLAGMAFGALTSVQEMTFDNSDASQDHVIRALLSNISRYVSFLGGIDISVLGSREKWCFWANIFNVLYIHAWLSAPFQRVQDCANFYNSNAYCIAGHMFSLSDIKNGILRGNKPPYYALLPPFASGDPRLLFLPEEYSGTTHVTLSREEEEEEEEEEEPIRIKNRILLALIDAYLVPKNLENATAYNPRAFIDETEQTSRENAMYTKKGNKVTPTQRSNSTSQASAQQKNDTAKRMGEANEDEEDKEGDDEDEDEDDGAADLRPHKSSRRRRRSLFQTGTASKFAAWFRYGRPHGNRGAAFAHPCAALVPTALRAQLFAVEGHALRALSAERDGDGGGGGVPRAALPWLLHPGEFGATVEEITRTLQQSHSAAAGKRQQAPARMSK